MSSTIWRPFTQMKTAMPALPVSSASGEYLKLANGQKVIDAISSWWVITHGHCHPKIAGAIQRQSSELDQVLFANFTHPLAERMCEKLLELLPENLKHVFFSDNGSTAVEVALKACVQYWRTKNEPQRKLFLGLNAAYHGDTVGAMSVGGRSEFTQPFEDLLFQVIHAEHPTNSKATVDEFAAPAIQMIDQYKDQLAGIILEPMIQGAGGMITWPKQAVAKIAQHARDNDILVIFDEVMTGFGRTGRNFALEHVDFAPNLICLSKGLTAGTLPMSVTVATSEIYEAFLSPKKSDMFMHGHSFTGNPISCAAAVANLELLKEEDMNAHWRRIESINAEQSIFLKEKYSSQILDCRSLGTMSAIEVQPWSESTGYSSRFSEWATTIALERNVFLRPLGNTLYVLPPYCSSEESLLLVWEAIDAILDANDTACDSDSSSKFNKD